MNTLLKRILAAPAEHRSTNEIIRWWEKRRTIYNVIMLVAGLMTIILAVSLGEISLHDTVNVIPPILIFALSANMFYTLGWILEVTCTKFISNKEILQKTAPILFIAGVSLSLLFTLAIDIALLVAFFFGSSKAV